MTAPGAAEQPLKAEAQPVLDPWTQWCLFATLLVSFAYFHVGGGPSQNSRFALTRAMVRHASLTIDAYQGETMDKAVRQGRFYCDKAPGLAAAAIPGYALSLLIPLPACAPGVFAELQARLHVATVLSVGVVSAWAGVALFRLLMSLGAGRAGALAATLAWALGTPAFVYAAAFMSHQFVAALLVIALEMACRVAESKRPLALAAGAGALAALAVTSEYPAAVMGLMLFVFVWARARSWRAAAAFAAGAAPLLALALAYNWACFGAPWRTGYAFEESTHFRVEMAKGFMGIGAPSIAVLWQITFGFYRGLFTLSPFLLLAAPGFLLLWRRPRGRSVCALCLAAVLFFLAFGSAYYMWGGGASFGPRHLVPMIPFLVVPAAFALPRFKGFAILLAAYSVAVCLVSISTFPEFPDTSVVRDGAESPQFPAPVADVALPLFGQDRLGEKAVTGQGVLNFVHPNLLSHRWDAYNLGEVMGLAGRASLLPLLAVWLAAAAFLFGRRRRAARSAP